MKSSTSLETVLKKDRYILLVGLLVLSALTWYYILYLYQQMYPMKMDAFLFAMPMTAKWTVVDFILLFFMWFVMMVAMMTPSVAPLILIFAMVNRKRKEQRSPFVPTNYFLTGYFIVWIVFSLLATVLQWFLQQINWLSSGMVLTNKVVGATILIAAGLFQFTPLKGRCLRYCQTPVAFIHRHWKEGRAGALKMGIKNGLFCLGCCWILMVVLFVSGVMNLLWIALIALFVLLEKLLPRWKWISQMAGVGLVLYGLMVLYTRY